ncbi:MAG: CHAD domain-containing protein, partial [Thermoanaerobaculia bacterium]
QSFLDEPLPEAGAPPLAEKEILLTASSRIWKAFRKVLKQGLAIDSSSPPEILHRLRIDCKKLRYLLEFFRSLYDEDEIRTLVKALKHLQDNLGDFNDLEIQQDSLQRFAHEMFQEGLATGETLMALGRLVDRLETRQEAERQRFQQELSRFASKKNRARFRALFKQQTTVAT